MTITALLLLIWLFPQSCAAAGGERWWCDMQGCYNSDYSFVETMIIMILVVLAVLFEGAHHKIERIADHSYFYGKLQIVVPEMHAKVGSHSFQSHSVKMRTPLFKHWVNRLSKELMVLGFLAFLVFVFREAGGFDGLVKLFPHGGDIMMPKTAEDWLHMVENAHMKLFLGMIIYFLVILRVVKGCVKHVEFWEEMRILRRNGKAEEAFEMSSSPSDPAEHNTGLQRYSRWRMYFIQSVMTWRETRPKLYEETLRKLNLLSCDTPSQSRFQRVLDEVFPFSAYLAYSVRECCKDTVDVHRTTWGAVLVLFSIFAIIHRYGKLILLHIMPIFIVGAFILIFAVGCLVRRFRERVECAGTSAVHLNLEIERKSIQRLSQMNGCSTEMESGLPLDREGDENQFIEGFHERFSTELWVFRALQIVLFVLSYACARTVGDPNDWRNSPSEVMATSSGFLVLFLVLGSLLPKHVPNFAALMAMPPYVDSQNLETFFNVLEEYNADLVAVGGPPPAFLLQNQRVAATNQDNTDVKKVCARLDAAVVGLTAKQDQLSSEMSKLRSSVHTFDDTSSEKGETRHRGSGSWDVETIPRDSIRTSIRTHSASLESLDRSREIAHPVSKSTVGHSISRRLRPRFSADDMALDNTTDAHDNPEVKPVSEPSTAAFVC